MNEKESGANNSAKCGRWIAGNSCTFCATPAEWRGLVPGAVKFHACDLCRVKTDIDAAEAKTVVKWSPVSSDRGQLVALAVVVLGALLLPGCGAEPESEWTPLYILALLACLATVATVTVLCLTSLGRRWGVVETRDDVDAEADGVRR